MIFQIKLTTLKQIQGNPTQVNASVQNESSDYLKSSLGTFLYYHFIRDLFEDISEFMRTGDIAFCKPGIGDLCISWNLPKGLEIEKFGKCIQDGMANVSEVQKQKYWNKYSMTNQFKLRQEDNAWNGSGDIETGTFHIYLETEFHGHDKVVVNAN